LVGVEEGMGKRHVSLEKEVPSFRVTCYALEQGQRVADTAVEGLRVELLGGVQLGVDQGDLLQASG
jgi:hypothetical protein